MLLSFVLLSVVLLSFVSTFHNILLSREINLKAQSQHNVRARERLPGKRLIFGNWLWWNPCSVCCTAGILSSAKSLLGDDFRVSRTNKLLLWRLGYMWYCRWQVAISALRFSVFTSVQSRFHSSFLVVFTKNARKPADISKNVYFSSSLGRAMETTWRNTADFNMF